MKKIELPRISGRIRGFTLPADGAMYVFDYDEVFHVNLHHPSVEVLTITPAAFELSTLDTSAFRRTRHCWLSMKHWCRIRSTRGLTPS